MIPHGNLKPSFCTSWPILFLLKNALLDKPVNKIKEKFPDYLKDYTGKTYVVGVDVAEDDSDVKCAEFCIKHKCDFITADKKAYDEILTELKEVQSIEITRILEKEIADNKSPVYCLSFRIE